MRKFLYILFALAILIGIFIGGYWNGRQAHTKNNLPGEKSKVASPAGYSGEDIPKDSIALPPGTVKLTSEKQQLIGIKITTAEKTPGSHTIRTLGRVTADETRIYRINATIDGWITKAYSNSSGSFVRKNEVLATFYSPEFLSSGQALLFALGSMDRVQTTGKEYPAQKDQITQFGINLKQYRDSLKNLGMGDRQIDEMIRTRKYMENVDITSPADGFILVRNVSEGQRFDKGTELYKIADLSRIWILADVFEQEAQYFKPGMKAKVILPYQKKTYQATVSKVLPVFDASTRTLKVRLEVDNPGFTLRPDMFVDVEMPVQTPPAVTVPSTAILFTGQSKTVFVDRGNGYFEPRKVQTGWRLGDRVEITGGLMPGEKIVLSGNFFIDSESRLQSAAQGIQGPVSIDPVCGMEVEEAKARATGKTSVFQGKTYYFCNEDCKEQFDKQPPQFLSRTEKMPEHTTPASHTAPAPHAGHDR
jgi:membrane fusion protein, copper/silver efflux system